MHSDSSLAFSARDSLSPQQLTRASLCLFWISPKCVTDYSRHLSTHDSVISSVFILSPPIAYRNLYSDSAFQWWFLLMIHLRNVLRNLAFEGEEVNKNHLRWRWLENKLSKHDLWPLPNKKSLSYIVHAVLLDSNSRWEWDIRCFDEESSLPPIDRVLLIEVHVVDGCNLQR